MAKRNSAIDVSGLSPFELIFKATNDVLYDLDIGSGVVTWNEALFSQYGYLPDPRINTVEWWSSHIHPEDALGIENRISEWLESRNDTWRAEYRFQRADGGYNIVRDRGYVIRDAQGQPERIIGSFLDITKERQLENAKDEFISLVSHQLRTPLTVIRTYGEMLRDGSFGALPAEHLEPINRMTDASIRLIELVSDILNISKIELSKIAVHPVPTDINQLVLERIDELKPLTEDKHITTSYQPIKSETVVNIDPIIVGQVLHNYLTNSLRYTRSNQGCIRVSVSRTKKRLLLSVQDNGIGIPKKSQQQIFGRFYRAHNAANIEEHGNGLGLYLVKLLADACSGKVWFESSRGNTVFYFQVPIK